ncbi:hypothetical protein [Macrococcoides caseolyticum]|uniref:hypothetical protein n=1 Tax=Macrococcoides caseolyticum TaxID=69966 RepID=UPI001F48586C|nr:hypothetical protein [Macrococcus caseolyticus]MCE4957272.1 hypothetical protein [Macrococcus caseolyticus]
MSNRAERINDLIELFFNRKIKISKVDGSKGAFISYENYMKNKEKYVSGDEKDGVVPSTMKLRDGKGDTIGDAMLSSILKAKNVSEDNNDLVNSFLHFYYKMFGKFSRRIDDTSEFIQIFLFLMTEAGYALKELETVDELLADKKLFNTRIKYIKQYIEHRLPLEVNPDVERVNIGEVNGKARYKYIKMNGIESNSINNLITNDEGENTEIGDTLDDSSNFFNSENQDAQYNFFLEWFLENRERLLTKKQLTQFELLREVYITNTDRGKQTEAYRKAMLEDVFTKSDYYRKFKMAVKKRVLDAYNREFEDKSEHGYRTKYRKEMSKAFTEFIEIADNPQTVFPYKRQVDISKHVAKYYDEYEDFEVTICKDMALEDKKDIVRCVNKGQLLSHRQIRIMRNNIMKYIEKNKEFIYVPAKQYNEDYSEFMFDALRKMSDDDMLAVVRPDGSIVAVEKDIEELIDDVI